jgi:uncharacterized protein YukE
MVNEIIKKIITGYETLKKNSENPTFENICLELWWDYKSKWREETGKTTLKEFYFTISNNLPTELKSEAETYLKKYDIKRDLDEKHPIRKGMQLPKSKNQERKKDLKVKKPSSTIKLPNLRSNTLNLYQNLTKRISSLKGEASNSYQNLTKRLSNLKGKASDSYQQLTEQISQYITTFKNRERKFKKNVEKQTKNDKIIIEYEKKNRPKRKIPYKTLTFAGFAGLVGLASYLTYQTFENKGPSGKMIINETPQTNYLDNKLNNKLNDKLNNKLNDKPDLKHLNLDTKPEETPTIQETKYLNGIEIKNQDLTLEQMIEQGRKYGLTGIYASISGKELSEIKPENYNNGINKLAEVANISLFIDGKINDLLTKKDIEKIFFAYRENNASKTVLLVPDLGDGNNLNAKDYVKIAETYNSSTRTGIDTIAENYGLSKAKAKKAVLESKKYTGVDSIKFTKQLGEHLSVADSLDIVNAYKNNTNKKALEKINNDLDLNGNNIYAFVDAATKVLSENGIIQEKIKYRKTKNNLDLICNDYILT